jgi:CheY-like chemotaxis protein
MARILVIDDNDDVRTVIAAALVAAGHDVEQAADGGGGIAIQRGRPVDLVITDILMPEKEGIETIRDLKEEFPHLKIIAMSGAGERLKGTSHLWAAKELGAHTVLRKPFSSETLLELVHEALASRPADDS